MWKVITSFGKQPEPSQQTCTFALPSEHFWFLWTVRVCWTIRSVVFFSPCLRSGKWWIPLPRWMQQLGFQGLGQLFQGSEMMADSRGYLWDDVSASAWGDFAEKPTGHLRPSKDLWHLFLRILSERGESLLNGSFHGTQQPFILACLLFYVLPTKNTELENQLWKQLESCLSNWLEPNKQHFTKNEQKPGDSPNSPNSTIQLGWPAGYQAVFSCFQPLLRSMISWNGKAWRNTPRRSLKSQMLLGSIGWSQKGGRFFGDPNSWWSQVFKRLELGFWDIYIY